MIPFYTYMISIVTASLILVNSCNQTKAVSVNQFQNITVETSDCFPDRKNQDTVQVSLGTIEMTGDSYYILSIDNNRRYTPCNMPDACKTKGLTVECVVIKKEIFPNERWYATPAMLLSISIKE